jgi:hypothetical protein
MVCVSDVGIFTHAKLSDLKKKKKVARQTD